MFGSDTWKPTLVMMSNIGVVRFDPARPLAVMPKILRLHGLSVARQKGYHKGRQRVFKLSYVNDKEKQSHKFFSVDDPEHYEPWFAKISEGINEYKRYDRRILLPP